MLEAEYDAIVIGAGAGMGVCLKGVWKLLRLPVERFF